MECMEISQGVMHQEAWQSNPSIWVRWTIDLTLNNNGVTQRITFTRRHAHTY